MDILPIASEECLGGYQLSSLDSSNLLHKYCTCDNNQRHIVLCEEDQDSIIIQVYYTRCIVSLSSVSLSNSHINGLLDYMDKNLISISINVHQGIVNVSLILV